MIQRVLIIGGYGNFGRFISNKLALEKNLQLIIAGRNPEKGSKLVSQLDAHNEPEVVRLDIFEDLEESFSTIQPDIVIHTSGPFQTQSYIVAKACLERGCHYLDLADAREFVNGISVLNHQAIEKRVLLVTGASSVPTLTCAIIDAYKHEFETFTEVDSAITTAQITAEGLATTQAILSYVGKTFSVLKEGKQTYVFGWQDMRFRKFWQINSRALCNCNIPDFDVLPKRYPNLKSIRFQAGIELKFQHVILYFLSFLVRVKLLSSLAPFAKPMLAISKLFEFMSSGKSGYFLNMKGLDQKGNHKLLEFDLVARQQHGQLIPCIPVILLTKKLAADEIAQTGATPCVGLLSLEEYIEALSEFDIQWRMKVSTPTIKGSK